MKKRLLSCLILCACAVLSYAQTLTIPDVEVIPGKTASFAFKVNVNNTDYKAISFTMQFPKTGFTLGKTTTLENWTGDTGTLDENGEANGTFYNTSSLAMPYGDIELGTISFTVADNVALGEYTVTLSKVQFATMDNKGADIADVTFKINVVNVLTIDEKSTVLPEAQSGIDVLVKRTINKGVWTPICLPFDMTDAQVKEIFGEDVVFAEFSDFSNDGTNFEINFSPSDIAADKFYGSWPYIVKTSKDITEFTVKAVTVDPKEDEAIAEYETGSGKKKTVVGTFTGTLKAGTVVPENNLILENGVFKACDGSTTIDGLQGYLWLKDFTATSTIVFKVGGEIISAIKELNVVTEDGNYYNINGMKVVNPTEKGIYIRNGKKVVVK